MKMYNTPELELLKAATDVMTVSEQEVVWDEE